MGEKTILTCPNKSCEKVFNKPLKTMNLQQGSEKAYNACPRCLTEINVIESESNKPQENTIFEAPLHIEMPVQEKEFSCQYHLGYLKERERKSQIPDECILCKSIIDCMLEKNEE